MTRRKLIEAVKDTAEKCGYRFHTGMKYRMNAEIKELPAVWMLTPKLTKTEGRTCGFKHYDVVCEIMAECRERQFGSKEEMWEQMEEDALRMVSELNDCEVIASACVTQCVPSEFTLTNKGELSMSVAMNVKMPFISKKIGVENENNIYTK